MRSKRPPVPSAEGDDQKEVFTFYGFAGYVGQVLERGVVNLAVGLRAKGLTTLTREGVESARDTIESSRMTLGALLKDVRKRLPVTPATEHALNEAVLRRNYLVHHFFVERQIDFGSAVGRAAMIEELRAIAACLAHADELLDEITYPLWAELGLTEEILEREFQLMRAEARERDLAGGG